MVGNMGVRLPLSVKEVRFKMIMLSWELGITNKLFKFGDNEQMQGDSCLF